MKVSYMKGLANHHGPESCLDAPQGGREALTGESAGKVLSSDIIDSGSRPCSVSGNAIVMSPVESLMTGEEAYFRRSHSAIACMETPYTEIGRPGELPHRRHTAEGNQK